MSDSSTTKRPSPARSIDNDDDDADTTKRLRRTSNTSCSHRIINDTTTTITTTTGSTQTKYITYTVENSTYLNGLLRKTNDEIHTSILLCPIMSLLIDTRVFQRLRGLKQLGTAYLVYMNGNHCRFEHSLGVAYLAEKLVLSIRAKQPAIAVTTTDKDVLCIKLAGLLHDIGHGPFSHTYEQFIQQVTKKQTKQQQPPSSSIEEEDDDDDNNDDDVTVGTIITHEDCSLRMIDYLLQTLGLAIDTTKLDEPLQQIGNGLDRLSMRVYTNTNTNTNTTVTTTTTPSNVNNNNTNTDPNVLTSRDWIYIKELILGGPLPNNNNTIIGRPNPYYGWTYDIVANKNSGLDVDKIDYYARDDRRCCKESGEIAKHFIEEAIVAWVPIIDNNNNNNNTDGGASSSTNNTNTNTATTNNNSKKIICYTEHIHPITGYRLMICYPTKLETKVLAFFHERYKLHRKIYQHKTCVSANLLVIEILIAADPYYKIPLQLPTGDDSNDTITNKRNRTVRLSQVMLYPQLFVQMEDSIIDIIGSYCCNNTDDVRLKKVRLLIERFKARNLYRYVGRKTFHTTTNRIHAQIWNETTEDSIQHEILTLQQQDHERESDNNNNTNNNNNVVLLTADDFVIVKIEYHYGQKERNPLSSVRFVSKSNTIMKQLSSSNIEQLPVAEPPFMEELHDELPTSFIKRMIRVYSRTNQWDVIHRIEYYLEVWLNQTLTTLEQQHEGTTTTTSVTAPNNTNNTNTSFQDRMLVVNADGGSNSSSGFEVYNDNPLPVAAAVAVQRPVAVAAAPYYYYSSSNQPVTLTQESVFSDLEDNNDDNDDETDDHNNNGNDSGGGYMW